MFKNFLQKRLLEKQQCQESYEKGSLKTEQIKNEEIKRLKVKFRQELLKKDLLIAEKNKKIDFIENDIELLLDIINRTNAIIKKVDSNSYARSMLSVADHQTVHGLSMDMDLLNIRINKNCGRIKNRILNYNEHTRIG